MGFLARTFGLEPATLAAGDVPVGDYSSDVQPPRRDAVLPLSTSRAVTLPAVFRAIQLVSAIGSSLTLEAYRGGTLVDPTPSIILQPDPWRSRRSFLRRWLVNAATDGNNFVLKHPGADGSVASGGVELLNPHTTRVRWDLRDGRRVKLYDGVDPRTGKARTYADSEVIHAWCGLEVAGHDRALGPVAACRYALTGIIETRDYASGWFSGNADDVPSGVLSTDQTLDAPSAAFYRRVWSNPQGLDEAGNPLPRAAGAGPSVRVLGKGLKYEPVLLKPADAQWLESQGFGVLEVARMFGLPAEYLEAAVDGSSLVYSSLPMLASRFLTTTMFPVYLGELEDVLTAVTVRGQVARFSADELLRPDAKTRAEVDAAYIEAGVYDGAYVRDRDRIPHRYAGTPRPAPQEVPAP